MYMSEDSTADMGIEVGPTENLLNPDLKISQSDFQYLKVIGRGAFAKVYLVRKKDTG